MPLREAVGQAIDGGVDAVQLREKDLPGRELFELARELRSITLERGALFIVNDRVDIALALRAHGVHLGSTSIPIRDARRLLPPGTLIGYSAHTAEEAEGAVLAGADYLFHAPIFAPGRSSVQRAPQGPEAVWRLSAECPVPVYALGGITSGRTKTLMHPPAGTGHPPAGVAVIRAILAAPDIRAAAAEIAEALLLPRSQI